MTVATLIPVGQTVVALIAEGDRIAASLKSKGPFEPETLAKWANLCGSATAARAIRCREATVLDVGAYTGLFSIAARKLGCRVIAFEPMVFNRARFKANCVFNGVDDAVNSEAVSDACGEAVLHYNSIPFTAGASLERKTGSAQPVKTLTIDSLNLRSVAAIKIDVERAEPRVLAGARETLARCRPALIVEVLGEDEGQAVLASVEDYEHVATMDVRNWLMLAK
jgi:FkbM family methyltransferase